MKLGVQGSRLHDLGCKPLASHVRFSTFALPESTPFTHDFKENSEEMTIFGIGEAFSTWRDMRYDMILMQT